MHEYKRTKKNQLKKVFVNKQAINDLLVHMNYYPHK